jgi:membrane protease YdiL (CAAX protease family)
MGSAYLDLARQGLNAWWRYALAIVLLLFVAVVLSGILDWVVEAFLVASDARDEVAPLLSYLQLSLAFLAVFLAFVLIVPWIHRRPLQTWITPAPRVRWQRVWLGAGVWVGLVAVMAVIEALLYPGRYQWSLNLPRFLPFLVLVLILTPIQTSAEELFFRGYLLQAFGLLTRRPLLLIMVTALLFALPHLANPEVAAGEDYGPLGGVVGSFGYFVMGVLLAAITLRDNGLELALGVHAANNLFAGLVVNTVVSSLEVESIFLITVMDPYYSTLSTLIVSVAFYLLLFHVRLPARARRAA